MEQRHGAMIRLTVNGETRESRAADLSGLLAELALDPATVVAEVNGAIVPGDRFAAAALRDGDRVELVRFVGGG